jgi:hypothetical protein
MKKIKDNKALLFENMAKLNPDFNPKKVLIEDKNWIQKAVDPEHKGYCTPMTKPTCTPKRKALAKRFKKGIEDEGVDEGFFIPAENIEQLRKKAEEIKAKIDKFLADKDYDGIDTLHRLVVKRVKPPEIPDQTNLA